MMRHYNFRLMVGILVLALAATNALAQKVSIDRIDAVVEKALAAFEVPGISLAIVKDGRVIAAKGYGKGAPWYLTLPAHHNPGSTTPARASSTRCPICEKDEDVHLLTGDDAGDESASGVLLRPLVSVA